jgi:hypothetical protein
MITWINTQDPAYRATFLIFFIGNTMNNKPITKALVIGWDIAKKQADKLECEIIDRITYILKFWVKTFEGELFTWYFEEAEEGEVGNLSNHIDEYNVYGIILDYKIEPDNYNMPFINKDGKDCEWKNVYSSIPVSWLYDNSFEEEIVIGKKTFEDRIAAKRFASKEKLKRKQLNYQKLLEDKKQDVEIIKSVKERLSAREIEALKRSL